MHRLLAACVIALAPTLSHGATVVSNTLVFGDSLSDPGNIDGNQFSDGDVWATQLGLDLASGVNFAVGGATAAINPVASDFAEQRSDFAASGVRLAEFSQAVVWFGGNDLLDLLSNPLLDPTTVINNAVGSLFFGIQDLAFNSGVDRFVVAGLPNFAEIPAAFGSTDAARASLSFNGAVQTAIAGLNASGIDTRFVDIAAVVAQVQADPAFTNLPPETCLQGAIDCTGFAFWDPIHPTEAAHVFVADAISAELVDIEIAPVPLPAGAVLLLTGLVAFGALSRRQAA